MKFFKEFIKTKFTALKNGISNKYNAAHKKVSDALSPKFNAAYNKISNALAPKINAIDAKFTQYFPGTSRVLKRTTHSLLRIWPVTGYLIAGIFPEILPFMNNQAMVGTLYTIVLLPRTIAVVVPFITDEEVRERMLNELAKYLDENFERNYPVFAKILRKIGVTSKTGINESKALAEFTKEKAIDLWGATQDLVLGFWEGVSALSSVTAKLILEGTIRTSLKILDYCFPRKNNRSKSSRLAAYRGITDIGQSEVFEDFSRGVSYDLGFLWYNLLWFSPVIGTSLLRGLYQSLRNEVLSNDNAATTNSNINGNANTNTNDKLYNLFLLGNLILLSEIGFINLARNYKYYFQETILNSIVVNDGLSRMADNDVFKEIIKTDNETASSVFFDPRPESLKRIVSAKIFESTEALIKDTAMLGLLSLNNVLIGSPYIIATLWLGRAYVAGKDPGASLLSTTGLSSERQRRIKRNRHGRFTGHGAAFLMASFLPQVLFNYIPGFNNARPFMFGVNLALSNIIYKLFLASIYSIPLEHRESDWAEDSGISFTEALQPVFFDPLMKRYLNRLERKLKASADKTAVVATVTAATPAIPAVATATAAVIGTDTKESSDVAPATPATAKTDVKEHSDSAPSIAALVKSEEKEKSDIVPASVPSTPLVVKPDKAESFEDKFWRELMEMEAKEQISPNLRSLLKRHAMSIIFFLDTFQKSRNSGGEHFVRFLSLMFAPGIQKFLGALLAEISDERIDKAIKFLSLYEASVLLEPKKPVVTPPQEHAFQFLGDANNATNKLSVAKGNGEDENTLTVAVRTGEIERENPDNRTKVQADDVNVQAIRLAITKLLVKKSEKRGKIEVENNIIDFKKLGISGDGPISDPVLSQAVDQVLDEEWNHENMDAEKHEVWKVPRDHDQFTTGSHDFTNDGKAEKANTAALSPNSLMKKAQLSPTTQQLLHYFKMCYEAGVSGTIEMAASGAVSLARQTKATVDKKVPGGLTAIQFAATATTMLVPGGAVALVAASTAVGASATQLTANHGDVIEVGAAGIGNVITNLRSPTATSSSTASSSITSSNTMDHKHSPDKQNNKQTTDGNSKTEIEKLSEKGNEKTPGTAAATSSSAAATSSSGVTSSAAANSSNAANQSSWLWEQWNYYSASLTSTVSSARDSANALLFSSAAAATATATSPSSSALTTSTLSAATSVALLSSTSDSTSTSAAAVSVGTSNPVTSESSATASITAPASSSAVIASVDPASNVVPLSSAITAPSVTSAPSATPVSPSNSVPESPNKIQNH